MTAAIVYNRMQEESKYEEYTESYQSVVVRLHERQEATNRIGDFENIYEALLEDGSIREITLETYLASKEGDTLVWEETFRRLKNK